MGGGVCGECVKLLNKQHERVYVLLLSGDHRPHICSVSCCRHFQVQGSCQIFSNKHIQHCVSGLHWIPHLHSIALAKLTVIVFRHLTASHPPLNLMSHTQTMPEPTLLSHFPATAHPFDFYWKSHSGSHIKRIQWKKKWERAKKHLKTISSLQDFPSVNGR